MKNLSTPLLLIVALGILPRSGAWAQITDARLQPSEYQALKDGGLLPAGYSGYASVAVPAEGSKGKKPMQGVLKGGGGGSCDCWIQPDATYTLAMPPNDDQSSGTIFLPFTFNLYGDLYTSCNINNNGNVTFGCGAFGGFTSTGFPASSAGGFGCYNMVAPFWADVDTRGSACAGPGGGEVWYKVTPTALYVNWVNVGYYGCMVDKHNTFQLIVTDGTDPVIGIGKNVSFCYGEMEWTTGGASGGTAGFGGTAATVGANRGNGTDYIQFTRPDQPGAFYDGPFLLNDGIDWLDNKNFVFTTVTSTANIPPIGSSVYLCDTLQVCVGQQVQFDFTFLSPEPGQITTATSGSTLSNYTELVNTPGATALITAQFTPLPGEVGYQYITFDGTDNGTPPLTATYNIVVEVFPAPATATGAVTVCSIDPNVDLLAQLSPPLGPGGDWIDPAGNTHTGTLDPATDISGDYIYAVGTGAGCPSTGTVTVNIVTAANAGTDAVLATCNSNPAQDLFLLLGGSPDAGGAWTAPGGLGFTNPLDPSIAASGAYTYTVAGTTPCPNDQSVVTVNIANAVDAGLDAALTLCVDATPLDMLASLGGTPDASGNWYAPAGTPFGGTFDASADVAGTYLYVTPAIAPCESDSSTLTISIDPAPDAGLDATLTLCANEPNVTLFDLLGGAPDPGGSWIDPDQNGHSGILDPSTELSGNYLYVAYGAGECDHLTDTAKVVAALNHMPETAFSGTPLAGCNPLNVQFTNNTPADQVGSCDWSFGDGESGGNTGTFAHTYNDPGAYTVTLAVTSPEGCVTEVVKPNMVEVTPAPLATFLPYPNPATVESPTVLFTATDPQAITWNWIIEGLDTLNVPEFSFDFPDVLGDTYEVCLTVTDIWGCTDTQCQEIVVKDPLLVFLPNSFTPNGDGVNDFFYANLVGDDPSAYKMYVYDRWGGKVFESTDRYNVWNGTYMNRSGELLPEGVYAWRLLTRLDGGGRKEYMGHVTLLK